MITEAQLKSAGFKKDKDKNWYLGIWDYKYEVSTRLFFDMNDGFGEPQEIAKIKDFDHLSQVLEVMGWNWLED